MTLVSSIIQDAYRESNITAIGTSLTAAQQEEGLRLLRTLQLDAFRIAFKTDDTMYDLVAATPLEATDTWSFSPEYDDYFIIGLALRLNPRHGAQLDQQSLMRYKRAEGRFRARYKQTVAVSSELAYIIDTYGQYSFIDFETGDLQV